MLNRSQYSINVNLRFAFIFCLVVVAGCADQDADALRFGLASGPVTLDPRFATDATSYRITRLVYQSLVDFDEAHRPVPAVAQWERYSPLHYRFFLKSRQSFHDGRPLTSADVVATYRSILDPTTASPHRGSLENIASIDKPSELVVDFRLHDPDPLFPGLLVIGIMPADALVAGDMRLLKPIGSGPFEISGKSSDSDFQLRRVSDRQLVEFITVRDATVRALKMQHGEIDIMQGSMTPELVAWLDRREGIRAVYRPGTTFTYLGFNLNDPDVGQKALRTAIAHAIDRESLTKFMFGSHARLAQAVFTPDHWAGHSELEPIEYDPQRAREIIADLGYSDEQQLHLSYKTSSDHFRLRVATVIQKQLAEVGIDMNIQSYDWGTFYADVKAGRFQMYSLSWVGLKQPDIFRYAFHSDSVPPAGANRGRYTSTSIDELIEVAESSDYLQVRTGTYRDIQQKLLTDLPYVPMWYEDTTLIYRESVIGYDTGIDGHYDGLIHARRDELVD
jgi:peptide/nickel transport system substrate-binding protein